MLGTFSLDLRGHQAPPDEQQDVSYREREADQNQP